MQSTQTITLAERATRFCASREEAVADRNLAHRFCVKALIISSALFIVPLALIQTVAFGCLRPVALPFGKLWGKESLDSSLRALWYFNPERADFEKLESQFHLVQSLHRARFAAADVPDVADSLRALRTVRNLQRQYEAMEPSARAEAPAAEQ